MANYANVQRFGHPLANGWQENNLTKVYAANGQSWQVHKDAAPAMQSLIDDLTNEGYDPKSSGGFNYRTIRGKPNMLSQHAFGNAIDINAPTNALGSRTTDMPQATAQLAAKNGLEWGGLWPKRPDPMHFEWTGQAPQLAPPRFPAHPDELPPARPTALPDPGPATPRAPAEIAAAAPQRALIPGRMVNPVRAGILADEAALENVPWTETSADLPIEGGSEVMQTGDGDGFNVPGEGSIMDRLKNAKPSQWIQAINGMAKTLGGVMAPQGVSAPHIASATPAFNKPTVQGVTGLLGPSWAPGKGRSKGLLG